MLVRRAGNARHRGGLRVLFPVPARTKLVFFDTLPAAFPPSSMMRLSISARWFVLSGADG